MSEKDNYITWHASFYVWCEQIWRIASAYAFFIFILLASSWLMPVVYSTIMKLAKDLGDITYIVLGVFYIYVSLKAMRASLTDRYSTFTLAVESKKTGKSVYKFDKHVSSQTVFVVWFSQNWRILLLPAAVFAGIAVMAIHDHQNVWNYVGVLLSTRAAVSGVVFGMFVFSIWATHEALSDIYPTFRFAAKPKEFYQDPNRPMGV